MENSPVFTPFDRTRPRPSTSGLALTLSKLRYYTMSVPRLLVGIKKPWRTVAWFLGLEPFPGEIELRSSGLRLAVRNKMDVWVAKETWLDDCYFPSWLSGEPDWRIIDIGGGVGDFAVMVATRCPQGVVHVYEPAPDAFTLLQANVRSNGLGNVVAHPKAVAAEACAMSATPHGVATWFTSNGAGAVEASAISLASALDALPGGECDFLKIDCEGCEFELLLGCDPACLRRVHRISLEFHDGVTPHTGADIAAHLESHGFRVWEQPNPVHRHLGQLYAERTDTVLSAPTARG